VKIYYFNEATRAHAGEGRADPDPLDRGRYLIPGNATDIEPPIVPTGMTAVFGTDAWLLVPYESVPNI